MKTLVVPPSSPVELDGPVVFLAGPIQGADDWQDQAIAYLQSRPEKLMIASPRRGSYDILSQKEYEVQVDWETDWLELAGIQGVILFWCAKEFQHDCGRAYAQTTRTEVGEWLLGKATERHPGSVRIAFGIEEGYTGAKYYRHRVKRLQEWGRLPGLTIKDNLIATCDEALKLLPKWS